MKKILLIGSTGFIGTKLKKEFLGKYNLVCPTRKKGFDITKKKSLKKYLNETVDLVINLSGQQNQNKTKMVNTIYKGNLNILEISKKIKKEIILIYISTSLVYGNSNKIKKEDAKVSPINLYEKTKRIIEKKYQKLSKNFLILRFCNIYGENSTGGIIKLILRSIKKKTIFEFDNLKTVKNFIHVNDVIKIINYLIIKKERKKIFNVGHENIVFRDLAQILVKLSKNRFRFIDKNTNINLTLSQKIENKLIKKIMKNYRFQSLKKYLKNEITSK